MIGAPGAFLGTSDAGAAYLFDADPSSPTFGNAIAAVQEPTPTSGDAFGTSVGFDTGALIVGAAGAIGSGVTGAEAVDLYQPGAQIAVSSVTTYLTPAPNDSVIVSGTFMDANPSATLTATINWGDGSAPTVVDLPAGSYAFAAPHDYTTDPASGSYNIGVTLSDAFGKTAFAQTTVAINNPAVAFASPGLVLSSTSIVEGGAINVSGTVVSSDENDTNTVSLNWGDGSAPTTIVLPVGQDTFSTSHTYLNNPAGVGSENYTITGSVTNQYDQVGYASASVTVNKVAPQFTAADLSLSPTTANEGDTITLSGQFTDPDALSSYTVTIDWGDGSTPTVLSELDGQVVPSATPGLYTYSTTHQYLSNPPGELTGGSYAINVSVSDGVNTTSAGTSIVVNNAAPTVRIESAGNEGSATITLTADVTDLDPLATDTVAWTLTQGGTVTQTGTGSTFSFANPGGILVGTVTATVTSSDGGAGSDSAQIAVISQSVATVTITASTITIVVPGNPDDDRVLGECRPADRAGLRLERSGGCDRVSESRRA